MHSRRNSLQGRLAGRCSTPSSESSVSTSVSSSSAAARSLDASKLELESSEESEDTDIDASLYSVYGVSLSGIRQPTCDRPASLLSSQWRRWRRWGWGWGWGKKCGGHSTRDCRDSGRGREPLSENGIGDRSFRDCKVRHVTPVRQVDKENIHTEEEGPRPETSTRRLLTREVGIVNLCGWMSLVNNEALSPLFIDEDIGEVIVNAEETCTIRLILDGLESRYHCIEVGE